MDMLNRRTFTRNISILLLAFALIAMAGCGKGFNPDKHLKIDGPKMVDYLNGIKVFEYKEYKNDQGPTRRVFAAKEAGVYLSIHGNTTKVIEKVEYMMPLSYNHRPINKLALMIIHMVNGYVFPERSQEIDEQIVTWMLESAQKANRVHYIIDGVLVSVSVLNMPPEGMLAQVSFSVPGAEEKKKYSTSTKLAGIESERRTKESVSDSNRNTGKISAQDYIGPDNIGMFRIGADAIEIEKNATQNNLSVERKTILVETMKQEVFSLRKNNASQPVIDIEMYKNKAHRIKAFSAEFQTDKGLKVGLPWREVLKIYPKASIQGLHEFIGLIDEPGIGVIVRSEKMPEPTSRILKPEQIPEDTVVHAIFVYGKTQ